MEQYSENVDVVAYYPHLASVGHTYQSVLEFDSRRYMFNGGYPSVQVYDITDPRELERLPDPEPIPSDVEGDGPLHMRGFFRYVPRLDKYCFVQSYSPPYVGFLENKYLDPERVKAIRNWPSLKGFRVFEMTSPTEFELVATVTSDPEGDPTKRAAAAPSSPGTASANTCLSPVRPPTSMRTNHIEASCLHTASAHTT